MTKQELNRDIKRLYADYEKAQSLDQSEYFKWIDEVLVKEYRRLYFADSNFEYMNRKSILIMLTLNSKFRIIPFHMFGINIKI